MMNDFAILECSIVQTVENWVKKRVISNLNSNPDPLIWVRTAICL